MSENSTLAGSWRCPRTSQLTSGANASRCGDYVHTITGASPHRLAFAPDGNCEVREQRQDPASVEFSLKGGLLTLRGASGGCRPIWKLLMSTSWYRS